MAYWIEDCELYFEIYGVKESKKVVVSGMHLEGRAKSWYQVFTVGKSKLV